MCLNFTLSSIFFSPLEQFEISSYTSYLSYASTFPIELFETQFFSPIINSTSSQFFVLAFILITVILLQTNLNQKGFLPFFVFIYVLLNNFNFFAFQDVVVTLNINNSEHILESFTQDNLTDIFLKPLGNFNQIILYVSTITSFTNIYSVFFCFIFIYIIIYLIYNKFLSNNTNTLIPNLYQIIGESLYKISLNLFYSILGKQISIPEFFIKINTIFVFLIISNVQGMIPYMSTLTSALTNTFYIALALFISILTTLYEEKGVNYFLNLFMPSGCPILLSLLIIPIEVISYSFRLVSLSVRLFANMMAGHTLLKVIVGFS